MSSELALVRERRNDVRAIMTSKRLFDSATAMVRLRPAEVGMLLIAGVAAVLGVSLSGNIVAPDHCPLAVPPITLRTVGNTEELVFLVEYSTFIYAEGQPQAPVADLRFELAEYRPGDNYTGPGSILGSGPLSSLNRNGSLQFHDMAAESEFSPGNDFFILLNPPNATVQLRILDSTGRTIAWNPIIGCA